VIGCRLGVSDIVTTHEVLGIGVQVNTIQLWHMFRHRHDTRSIGQDGVQVDTIQLWHMHKLTKSAIGVNIKNKRKAECNFKYS
jgi:hypothetical protein